VNASKPATFAIRRKCTPAFSFNRILQIRVFNADQERLLQAGRQAKKSIKHDLAARLRITKSIVHSGGFGDEI
jgi:hypothetical protein